MTVSMGLLKPYGTWWGKSSGRAPTIRSEVKVLHFEFLRMSLCLIQRKAVSPEALFQPF